MEGFPQDVEETNCSATTSELRDAEESPGREGDVSEGAAGGETADLGTEADVISGVKPEGGGLSSNKVG